MSDSSKSSNKKKKSRPKQQGGLPSPVEHGSSRTSPTSRGSSRASSRKSPDSRASSRSPPVVQIPIEKYVHERNIKLSTVSIANPSVVTSPLPWDNPTYNAPSTPDSQIESTCAFEGSKPSTPVGFKRKKKKKMKKKSQRRQKSHIPEIDTEDVQSSEENYFQEIVVDKLERIYKPKSVMRREDFSNVNLRVMTYSSSSDEEQEPSRTEYHIRTLNPKHNNFEMVSEAAQTDWSWLRDAKKLEEHELDGADIGEVMERLKYGLYGGFAPDRPTIVIKEDTSNPSQESESEYEIELEKKIEKVKEKDESKKPKRKTKVKKQKPAKQLDTKDDDAKKRPVKSASRVRGEAKPTRRIKSASAPRKGSFDPINKNAIVFDSKNSGQPEILKYHREKATMPTDLPSIELPDDPLDLPPADGIFNGPCQFCGKPIMTMPPLEEFGDDDDILELFCCPEYKHFIRLHLESFDYDQENGLEAELIDITPSAPYGIKQNRKIARERIAERWLFDIIERDKSQPSLSFLCVRERELERQRIATQQANLFTFARQMKTIQYSLASTKCMEEGWTVKPPTPSPSPPTKDSEVFHVEVNSTLLQKSEVLTHRFYENGHKFLTIFPDGTGCC